MVMASGFDLDVAENLRYKHIIYIHDQAALFEPNGLLREANKPSLADDANWNSAKATEMPIPSNREERNHVLDGGALNKWLPLSQNTTFHFIYNMYVE